MAAVIVVTNEFEGWYDNLTMEEQESIRRVVAMLEEAGVKPGYPQSSAINGSQFPGMHELRVQHAGRPYLICMPSIQSVRRYC